MENEWLPKTTLGKKVKKGEIKNIDEILDKSIKIMESEIVDILLPNLATELILVGQSRGKFGGGRRRVFKQTQKKTKEGNRPHFLALAIVGNSDGYIGMGLGKAKETVPAREKAFRNAKRNIFRIVRGCGSWECGCGEPHSLPIKAKGRSGSVRVELKPAPKGLGLCAGNEIKKIMKLAGIRDVRCNAFGQTSTRINLVKACFDALKKLSKAKSTKSFSRAVGFHFGAEHDSNTESKE